MFPLWLRLGEVCGYSPGTNNHKSTVKVICRGYRVISVAISMQYASLGSRLDLRSLLALYFLKHTKTITYFTNERTMQRRAIKSGVFNSQRRSVLFLILISPPPSFFSVFHSLSLSLSLSLSICSKEREATSSSTSRLALVHVKGERG